MGGLKLLQMKEGGDAAVVSSDGWVFIVELCCFLCACCQSGQSVFTLDGVNVYGLKAVLA